MVSMKKPLNTWGKNLTQSFKLTYCKCLGFFCFVFASPRQLKEARMVKKRNRHLAVQVLNRKHSFITKTDLCDPEYPKSFKALC